MATDAQTLAAVRKAIFEDAAKSNTHRLSRIAAIVGHDPGTTISEELVFVSRWVDEHNAHRDPEAQLWSRVTKASEEAAEAQGALRSMLGENPRKPATGTTDDLVAELLDTAVAALGAVEHVTGHRGDALVLLEAKIRSVADRARDVLDRST